MNPNSTSPLSKAEQAAELDAWKAKAKTITEQAKRRQAEYYRMLEARKRGDAPMYTTASGRVYK